MNDRNIKIVTVILFGFLIGLFVLLFGIYTEQRALNSQVDELGCRAWLEARTTYNGNYDLIYNFSGGNYNDFI